MSKNQIELKLEELRALKLPQLNKKSRAHQDWKQELQRLTSLLDGEINKMQNLLK
jgi:hypothetical protein